MAPRWLRLVLSWLTRSKSSQSPKGPRRRASFPAYQPQTKPQTAAPAPAPAPSNPNFGSLPTRQRRSTVQSSTPAPVYIPPGYIYHSAHGWIPVGNGMTYTAPAYQAHTGAASTSYRRLPNGQVVATTGYIPATNGVQQQQFYVFPQQQQQPSGQSQPGMMSQVPNAAPVTLPKTPRRKAPATPRAPSQPSAPPPSPRSPPPPPSRQQRSSRMLRANSAPAASTPYHASPKRIADAWSRYSKFWSGSYAPRTITFDNVPWPMVDPPKHPTSLTVNSVRSFLLSPHHSQGVPARERVETAQRQWGAGAFMARFGPKMKEDRDRIERTIGFLQGTLRLLHNEVVAAESIDDGSS